MNKPPAFQFYPDKWLAGTLHLSPRAYQAYHRVLCWMWLNSEDLCSIPHDETTICRASGLTRRCYQKVWGGEIMNPNCPLLQVEGNRLISNGLRKEAAKQASRRARARLGGQAHAKQCQEPAKQEAPLAPPKQCSPSPTPFSSPYVPSETNLTSLHTEVPKAFTKGLVGRFFTEQPQDVQQRLCRIAANTEAVYSLWALERALDDLGRQLSRGTKVENPAAYFATLCGKRIEQWQKDETTRAEWEANHKRDQDTEQEEQERLRQFPTDPEAQERWLKVQARFKAIKRAGHLSAEVTAVDMAEAKKALQEYLKKLEEQSNG